MLPSDCDSPFLTKKKNKKIETKIVVRQAFFVNDVSFPEEENKKQQ